MFQQGLYRGGGALRLLGRLLGSTAVAEQAQEAEEKEVQVDCLGTTWLSVCFCVVVAAVSVGCDSEEARRSKWGLRGWSSSGNLNLTRNGGYASYLQ